MPGPPFPKKKKASPNTSRAFDVDVTPALIREAEELRRRWGTNLRTFAEECGDLISRDDPRGAAIIPCKFVPSQIYYDELINSIAAFNIQRGERIRESNPGHIISHLPIETCGLKARKVGWSTYCEFRAVWLSEFNEGHYVLTMAHDKEVSRTLAQIAARFLDRWEAKVSNPLVRRKIVRSSDDLIEWDHDSRIIVKTAGTKVGGGSQGVTYHFEHLSELSRFPDDGIELASATTAAAMYREIHSESTARGDNAFKEMWDRSRWLHEIVELWKHDLPMPEDWNGKYRAFWAWHQDQGYRVGLSPNAREYVSKTLSMREKQLLETYELDLEQIQWRREKIKNECSQQKEYLPDDYFLQEYPSCPEEAFLAKGQKAFLQHELSLLEKQSDDIIKQVRNGERVLPFMGHMVRKRNDDAQTEWMMMPMSSFEGSAFVQFEEPKRDDEYVMAVDAAEGLEERDDSVIAIHKRVDPFRIREVARLISKFDPEELAEAAYYLHLLYNEAYLVAERKQPGNATCVKLVKLGCRNMFHFRNPELFSDRDDPESFTAGFDTNRSTKSLIVGMGQTAVRDGLITLLHPEAIKQWKQYEQKDGKYNAPSGKKDDCVVTDLLCLFAHSPGVAPPLGALRRRREEELYGPDLKLTPDELQNKYWAERLKQIKKRAAEEHERTQEQYYSLATTEVDDFGGLSSADPFGADIFT